MEEKRGRTWTLSHTSAGRYCLPALCARLRLAQSGAEFSVAGAPIAEYSGGERSKAYARSLWQKKAADRSAARIEWKGNAYQFFVMRNPNKRGSVVNTLVVRPVSSEFRNAPVMAVVLKTFFR